MREEHAALVSKSSNGQLRDEALRFATDELGSGRSLLVPRLIYNLVSLTSIPKVDCAFFENDKERAAAFVGYRAARYEYFETETALLIIVHCMDEREQDTEEMFGLHPGTANVVQIAGCMTDESNLPLGMYLQRKVKKASDKGKIVLILMITHQSEAFEKTDSCAAHGHDVVKADAHVGAQVAVHNTYGGDRNPEGRIIKRYRVAVHVKSYTDTESRVWVGFDGKLVDPMEYVARLGRPAPIGAGLVGQELEHEIVRKFFDAFPISDPRFEGLPEAQYNGLISQMARMCVSNILKVRVKLARPLHVVKNGHKGTRILIGRGWDMYVEPNQYFKIGDMIPDEQLAQQFRIALKYVCRNKLLKKRRRFRVPIHMNGLYNHDEEGDRSGTIRYAMGKARKLRQYVEMICSDPAERKKFDHEVRDALRHEGVSWDRLPLTSRRFYEQHLLDSLRVYVSVSARETRALELVATDSDL